jgi:hypothetical protein
MKSYLLILLLSGGCSQGHGSNAGYQQQLPDLAPPVFHPSTLNSQTLSTVLPPPPVTNEIVFHFIYPCALTNGFIQSSTDLVHWETRTDYTIDETNTWTVHPDPMKQMEFFRAGGETIRE